jgi:regulator of sigma E protease
MDLLIKTAIEKQGFQTGDKILSIDGKKMERYDDISKSYHGKVTVEIMKQKQLVSCKFVNQISNSRKKYIGRNEHSICC